jgi:hypothetical protein
MTGNYVIPFSYNFCVTVHALPTKKTATKKISLKFIICAKATKGALKVLFD